MMNLMMRALIPALCLALGCSTQPTSNPAVTGGALTKSEQMLVKAGTGFGFAMLHRLSGAVPGENVVISPVSISMALGMTMNGARKETLDSMREALGFGVLPQEEINRSFRSLIAKLTEIDPTTTATIANSIWYSGDRISVDPAFADANTTYFNAETRDIDFSAPGTSRVINQWVADKTRGKITSIVPDQIPQDAVMYLINALYFKGTWRSSFDTGLTRDDTFTMADGSTLPCRMMLRLGMIRVHDVDGATLVDLPYGNGQYSMTIALPNVGRTPLDLVAGLTPETWRNWIAGFRPDSVFLSMPRFTVRYEETLNDVLKEMGMGPAFDERCDLSGIGGAAGRLKIDVVRHKTFIEVGEEGTEAAAVTSVGVGTTEAEPPTRRFVRIDRPFFFAIHEKATGAITFMGVVNSI